MYKDTQELDNKYDSVAIENRCKKFWEEKEIYKYNPQKSREETFMIDTPPPTVSGSLHIGHIFSYTQTDVVARFQRMIGKTVFYPIGWDDNGLPTERRVQNYFNISCNPTIPYDPNFEPKHIENDKSRRTEVSRKNFIEACEILTSSDEKIFEDVFKNIGHSYDWSLKYSTIGNDTIKVSQKSFIDLFKDGHIQSVEAPTMWDTTFKTAVAQAEVEDREIEGFFHDLKFKVQGSDEELIIATTRPELLPACLAIVAHPDDERYKHLFGKKAIVPLFDILVDIVPSDHAEKDKGTGIMMVCTFGDSADVAWWKKSGLPLKQIINTDGRLIDIKFGTFPFESLNPDFANQNYSQLAGLTVKQAKTKIVELLKENGALIGEPRHIMHSVKFYEKGNLPLEFVSSRQWFVTLKKEKEKMLDAGRKIKWKPSHMHHRYEEWTEGLNQDWCISRQRFFGVPFPVWYKLNENEEPDYNQPILANENQLPVDPMVDTPNGYKEEQRGKPFGFISDPDVMDTWATSALTPQIALNKAKCQNLSLPFDVRPQAHDIIRTWAFYTIAKALLHSNTIPWKQALISGFILDPDRKKMSKSKGNVITPQYLIDNYGADAVRYWASRARLGIDTAFEEQIMSQGRKLVNKIFNANKFVLNIVSDSSLNSDSNYTQYINEPMDKSWIKKLSLAVESATKSFEQMDYATSLEIIESRFWDFCDNYLEIVKARAYSEDNKSAVASLILTIDTFSKMFAPFLPFITEEVYQARTWKKDDTSLHLQYWPNAKDFVSIQEEDSVLYDSVSLIISEIRKTKTNAKKTQKTPVINVKIATPDKLKAVLEKGKIDIENVGRLNKDALSFTSADELSVLDIQLDMEFVPEHKQN